jgi:hypothetical protein
MLNDATFRATASELWLILPLEQVSQDNDEITL